jgi:hypothetical protein
MNEFATLADVMELSGKELTSDEEMRVINLLPLISDALRVEANKVGKDLDAMVEASTAYASVVKLTIVDIVVRVLRQSTDGDPMTQETQSALGYSWSGTYAVPGGGISGAIMRNDLKRLGFRRQRLGTIELWQAESTE